MLNITEIQISDNASSSNVYGVSTTVRFWTYLFSTIVSFFCAIFVLYHLIRDRTLRHGLHNHVIIIILIICLIYEVTNIPWILYQNRNNRPVHESRAFNMIWMYIDYVLYSVQIGFVAWATIERHILIFHDRWMITKYKQILFHYLPMVLVSFYYLIFHMFIYLVPFCESAIETIVGGEVFSPCLFEASFLGMWDLIVNQLVPTMIIVIFSVALLFRIILQKRKVNQRVRWRKYKKLTIQLLSISGLYLFFNVPWTVAVVAYYLGTPEYIAFNVMSYSVYFYYYVIFLFPFVCCGSLPELRMKLPKFRVRVAPTNLVLSKREYALTPFSLPAARKVTEPPANARHSLMNRFRDRTKTN